MTTTTKFLTWSAAVALMFLLPSTAFAATATWTGGGDGVTWTSAANWFHAVLPTATSDVIIPAGTPVIQITTAVTINSLNCSEPLTVSAGSLTVTGPSIISAAFTVSDGSLTVTGPSIISAAFTVSGGSLTVTGPSTISAAFTVSNATLTASGIGASLNVTGTTTLTAANLTATGGGQLLFPAATSYTGYNYADTTISASGAGSRIDLSHLLTFRGGGTYTDGYDRKFYFTTHVQPVNGGEIDLAGAISYSGNWNDIKLDGTGGILGVAGVTSISGTTLVVSGGQTLVFGAVKSLASVNLTASAGSQLLFPAATAYTGYIYGDTVISANGVGSKIDLSHLLTFSGGGTYTDGYDRKFYFTTHVQPVNGGEIDLAGAINTNGGYSNDFTVSGAGSVLGVSGVTSLSNTIVTLSSGGTANFTSLTSLSLPNGITSIGSNLFAGCAGLVSVTIPGTVTSIGSFAFYGCAGLTSVTIPASVTSIGDGAFAACTKLTSFTVAAGNTSFITLGGVLCDYSKFTLLQCPGGMIGSYVIPAAEGITGIGNYAFAGCSNLISVTISPDVASIGNYAFQNCSALTGVIIQGNAPTTVGTGAFTSTAPGFTVYYKSGATGFTSPPWNGYPCTMIASAPTVTSPTTASIAATTATLGGNVTNNGGAAITGLGVVYAPTATNSNPQIGGTGVTNVTGTGTGGAFAVNITGLTRGTAYTFKAYATNSVGTSYSTIGTFVAQSSNASLSNLTVSIGSLSPAFASGTTRYSVGVVGSVSSLTLTATTANSNATLKVNGVAATSGSASAAIPLNANTTSIQVLVTAGDGITPLAYMVEVTRQYVPTVTTPTSANITATTATLGGNVTSIGGTPLTALGVVYAPTATNSNPLIGGTGVINVTGTITSGEFTVNVIGLTPSKAYTFNAYATNIRGTGYTVTGSFTTPSNVASLSNLALSGGTLAPAFATATTAYTANVSTTTTSLTVTPTATQANATIAVNGMTVASGSPSGPLSLALGSNTITTVVTAQDLHSGLRRLIFLYATGLAADF